MKFKPSLFFVGVLSLIIYLFYFILMKDLFNEDYLLFSTEGDEYNYFSASKFNRFSDEFSLIGLSSLNSLTGYTFYFDFIMKYGGNKLYQFIQLILFILSDLIFFKISSQILNKKNALIATIYFSILPLRHLWANSFYKENEVIFLLLSVIYFSTYRISHLKYYVSLITLFLIRPFLSIILFAAVQLKNKFSLIKLSLIGLLSTLIIVNYLDFISLIRFEQIFEKLKVLPFNQSGLLNLFYITILVPFVLIQPVLIKNNGDIFDKISPILFFEGLFKTILIPLIIIAFFNSIKLLKEEKIRNIYFSLLSTSIVFVIGFIFNTGRHIVMILPLQVLTAFYILENKKYNYSLFVFVLVCFLGINFYKLIAA